MKRKAGLAIGLIAVLAVIGLYSLGFDGLKQRSADLVHQAGYRLHVATGGQEVTWDDVRKTTNDFYQAQDEMLQIIEKKTKTEKAPAQ